MSAPSTKFERKPCTRCYGSGQYSYNQRDGSICYGCGGKGEMLTKRGRAAMLWYRAKYTEACLGDLKPGDRVVYNGVTLGGDTYEQAAIFAGFDDEAAQQHNAANGSACVVAIITNSKGAVLSRLFANPDYKMRRVLANDVKAAALADAYAYQDTLTATGTPRKRA